ncbi:MAG: cation-efflux pump [Spirochaetae bacterium HGW-Spirochaetae-2]|jgi:cation diffusion facilitator family transporter|nr:MAG: cation-efflux pump [Spirochaetae bacterium HGW-Spirochaetae-2]
MGKPERSAHTKTGVRISLISIISSILLSLLKLTTGIIGKSSALVSDGVNSISDVVSYTVVMGGVAASDREADSNHQYGHEKLESIVSVFLALVIFGTGVGIGLSGIRNIGRVDTLAIPTLLPLLGAGFSIITKLLLWQLTTRAAKKTSLNSLRALATDHLSDVLSSTGALVGVVGARLGYPVLDPIASVIIALLIVKSAVEVFRSAISVLMDSSVDKNTKAQLENAILSNHQVQRIDLLRTRTVGAGFWVEVEICCCRHLRLHEAHDVAEEIHDRIEGKFPKVRHVMVHTNPCSGDAEFCSRCKAKDLVE